MGHLITFKEFFDDEEGAKLNEDNSLLGIGWWRDLKTLPFSYRFLKKYLYLCNHIACLICKRGCSQQYIYCTAAIRLVHSIRHGIVFQ